MKNLVFIMLTALVIIASPLASAQSPREQLNQLVTQLQANPGDTALRERIIKLAQEIKPPPAIPEEASRAFVRGTVFQKEAKSPAGFGLAIKAFQEASLLAPWWGDAYYNLSIAQESAGMPEQAIASLQQYMLTRPSEKDLRDAQNRIYAIEAKKDLLAQERTTATAAKDARVQAMAGTWYAGGPSGGQRLPNGSPIYTWSAESTGNGQLRFRIQRFLNYYSGRGEVVMPLGENVFPIYLVTIDGSRLSGTVSFPVYPGFSCPAWQADITGEVKDGGRYLEMHYVRKYITAGGGSCSAVSRADKDGFHRSY